MEAESTRKPVTDAWGIDDGYIDALKKWQPTSDRTRQALRAAMGETDDQGPSAATNVRIVSPHRRPHRFGRGELILEGGGRLEVADLLPSDVPPGYHDFHDERGSVERVIVSPGSCRLPNPMRQWGWAVQLYAARSTTSWGMGDLADLRRLAKWSACQGASVLIMNPCNANTPSATQQPSPYYPSTRRFRNPLYLRIEEVPGFEPLSSELSPAAAAGRVLNAERRINRDEVHRLKESALVRLWQDFAGDEGFEQYRQHHGLPLRQFAAFCVLAEQHGPNWREWPAEYRRPDEAALARVESQHASRVGYQAWLQWLLDRQFNDASHDVSLVLDLPIGVGPDGFDAWSWQDALAQGVSVGAPPDVYNTQGQNWGLPPFIPHKLREARYEPFVETIRSALQQAGGLRIDHVLGLFRLFWIPQGFHAKEGMFVRYPADDLLDIIALESHRAGAFIVGEDLGTVEVGVPERLAAANVLSYRVLWFEEDPPSTYPELALAAITTHDLPTVAGLWTRTDVEAEQAIGKEPNFEAVEAMRKRVAKLLDCGDDAPVDAAIRRAHEVLAEAPSAIITATLDDALAVEQRPNMPGTVDEWPNWSLALPKPLEEIEHDPLAKSIAQSLSKRSVASKPGQKKPSDARPSK